MNRLLALGICTAAFGGVAIFALAQPEKDRTGVSGSVPKFNISEEKKNPWTGLDANWNADQFQFAVVADRTGGHRQGIFSRAVQQINLMQPEFVMSVGDLIEGNAANADTNRKQWDEFDRYAKQFKMPFFYCPGNHDAASLTKADVWAERYGRRYYHFTYKDTLFVVMNTQDYEADDPKDPPKQGGLRVGKRQREYLAKALADNAGVKWTFIFLHHPIWAGKDITNTGWLEVEEVLKGRRYNVFCGHVHRYRKYLRNGTAYYQLATTGGGSSLRGPEYGEFDQFAWITVGKDGPPSLANVMLNGVLKDDLLPFPTEEAGSPPPVPLATVTGVLKWKGKSVDSLQLNFTEIVAGGEKPFTGSARTALDGSFAVYGAKAGEGLKPGRYAVTLTAAEPLVVDPKATPREVAIPAKYAALNTTPWRVDVKAGTPNRFELVVEVPEPKKE